MGFNITLTEVGMKTCSLRLAYLKTIKAILKILELTLAAALICTITYYFQDRRVSGDLFFLLVVVNFFICTFCLLISEWIVWSSIIVNSSSKSMFEIVFFVISAILLFSSSINLFSNVIGDNNTEDIFTAYIICSILGFILVGLYTADFILSACLSSCRNNTQKDDLKNSES